MAQRTPKRFLEAHRLITGRDKLKRKSYGKAEYNHLAELRGIFEDRNIVGLGVSEKVTSKKRTGELALCFYVLKKKAKSSLGAHKIIPPVIGIGDRKPIFTDVYPIGRLKAQAGGHAQPRPIQSSFSLGNDKTTNAGTVGAIVRNNGVFYILSNAHVLAPGGQGNPGNVNATYPAREDTTLGTIRVGVLRHITNLQGSDNKADAALAQIKTGLDIDTSIVGATPPYTVGTAVEGMAVVGSGRTTAAIQGIVKDPHFAGSVSYPSLGSIGFVGQILCIGSSAGGDSGSLISAKTGEILGILVAGSGTEFAVTPIQAARGALGVDFQFVDPVQLVV